MSCSKSDNETSGSSVHEGEWNVSIEIVADFKSDNDNIQTTGKVVISEDLKMDVSDADGNAIITGVQMKVNSSFETLLNGDLDCEGCADIYGAIGNVSASGTHFEYTDDMSLEDVRITILDSDEYDRIELLPL